MKCPNNCNDGKFVSLETGDPEDEGNLAIDGEGNVTGTFRLTRNCAECGETLKEATDELEDNISDELDGHMNGPDGEGGHELSIELDACQADESGGSRYSKNIINAQVDVIVTCSCDKEWKHETTLQTGGVAAGSFEECC